MLFTKMQGAGNDYVYLDWFSQPPPRDPVKLSQAVSDRHFRIGSDGRARPWDEWRQTPSLEEAVRTPPRGQDTTVHDAALRARLEAATDRP